MKRFVLSALLYCCSAVAAAQTFTSNISESAEYFPGENLIPVEKGYLHIAEEANKKNIDIGWNIGKVRYGLKLTKFDNNFKPVSSAQMFDGEKKLFPGLFHSFKLQTGGCVVYHDDKTDKILAAGIDENSLAVKEVTAIDLTKNELFFDKRKAAYGLINTFQTVVSESEKMFLVVSEFPAKKNDPTTIFIAVLDAQLNPVMERKIDFKQDWTRVEAYLVDDYGNVFISYAGGNNPASNFRKGESIDKDRMVMLVQPSKKEEKVFKYRMPGFTNSVCNMIYSPKQDKVYLAGLYTKGWDENLLGVFYATIDRSKMEMSPVTQTDFPPAIVENFEKEKLANTGKKNFGLSRKFVPSYRVRGDGTVDLLMFHLQQGPLDNGVKGTELSWFASNLLDAHIINDKVTFAPLPRKMSSAYGASYLGPSFFTKEENLFVVYNDDADNIVAGADQKALKAVLHKSAVCVATIGKNGEVKREILFKGDGKNAVANPISLKKINNNSFLLLLEKLTLIAAKPGDSKFAVITIE